MNIHHVALSVRDIEKSIAFYEKLGFKIEKRYTKDKYPDAEAVFLKLEGVRLELWDFKEKYFPDEQYDNLKVVGLKHIALEVTLNSILPKLDIKKEIKEGTTGRYVFIHDPDNIPIELYEPYQK